MRKSLNIKAFVAFAALSVVITFTACGDGEISGAEELLTKATEYLDKGQFKETLETIDSLRSKFPRAIEQRKKALKLYQEAALKQAQEQLATTDSLLEAVKAEYEEKKAAVDLKREQLKATEKELLDVNMLRQKVDSLQTSFDTLCETIKYIHKKQKESDGD